ncbi:MAG: 4Fe-4S binding protein [Desulfobacterales bacterium]|nr:4Fe-4S binding protein [Desulfobacterales bacterium]
MYSQILTLRFSADIVNEPVVCYLSKDFDLTFAIDKATILPRREGFMVLKLSGSKENFDKGIEFLKSKGVSVKEASQEMNRNEEKCIHCGACTAVCPTGALSIKRPEMEVVFDKEKCIVCELCVSACIARVINVSPITDVFFE